MKKIVLLLIGLLAVNAWAGEPLMLVKPGREIFVNFPSAILPDKAITVFLPEESVPLHQKYPVVYLLGVWPKDAPAAEAVLKQASRKAILVGLNVEESDLADPAKMVSFFSQELVPYIDSNYPTLDEPSFRVIGARGAAAVRVLGGLLARKQLFGRALIVNSGADTVSFAAADKKLRVLAAGSRAQMAALWKTLQGIKFAYGKQVALRIMPDASLFDVLNLDYLFAPEEELAVAEVGGNLSAKKLFIASTEKTEFSTWVKLRNAMRFDYIALDLRIAPPYLRWDAAAGVLQPIAGAGAGKVKISVAVDKAVFSTKLKLKK